MVELIDITYSYLPGGKNRESVAGINLKVEPGEFLLLTGHSGCGKTTLTRIINGLCPRFFGGSLQGDVILDGSSIRNMPLEEIGLLVGSVFQDPRSQFFATNTTDEILFSMENRGCSTVQMKERLDELCAMLDLETLLDRNIFELSGGEKQKIAIASACAMKPPILVFDEPSANLDSHATEKLAQIMLALKSAGHTIIVSEHRLYYLKDLIDRMLVMNEGKVIWEADAGRIRSLTDEKLHGMGLRALSNQSVNCMEGSRAGVKRSPILEVCNMDVAVNRRKILDGLSFAAEQGEIIAITGRNGAGKSTLCKTIAGLIRESSGQIMYRNKATKPGQRLQHAFYVMQDADYQLFTDSVEAEILVGTEKNTGKGESLEDILEKLSLSPFRSDHPGSLSGGQKQRVLLAAAAVRSSEVLILDEPTSGLDGRNMRKTGELLRGLAKAGKCILLITHDMELVSLAATRLLVLENGRIAKDLDIRVF